MAFIPCSTTNIYGDLIAHRGTALPQLNDHNQDKSSTQIIPHGEPQKSMNYGGIYNIIP